MIDTLLEFAQRYGEWKRWFEHSLGVSDDLLHVHLGLAVFVLSALLLRRRMRSIWPLSAVVILAFLNEVIDCAIAENWSAELSALDLVNSIFWPLVLFLLARRGRAAPERI